VDLGESTYGDINKMPLDALVPMWKQAQISGYHPHSICRMASCLGGCFWYIYGGVVLCETTNLFFKLKLDTDDPIGTVDSYKIESNLPKTDSHTMCYLDGILYAFGGFTNYVRTNNVIKIQIGEETNVTKLEISGSKPSCRSNHSATIV